MLYCVHALSVHVGGYGLCIYKIMEDDHNVIMIDGLIACTVLHTKRQKLSLFEIFSVMQHAMQTYNIAT